MAKKSNPVKKAVPKKALTKKPVAKKVVKKAAGKKAVTKKIVAKKTIAKKVVKKAAVKKAVIKPAASRKAVAKKPIEKKTVAKKVIAIKKPVSAKVAIKVALPTFKKVVAKKKPAPAPAASASVILIPDGVVENTANINKQMLVPGDGLNEAPVKTEDPLKTFDKNVFNKATTKGDPHSNRHFSSKPKNAIKPSGKKPLW